ncbi:hypothetical protein [Sphingomonas sanxanigenens]|nr:hypothetical protein [Sphingomonas sanxanigenens]
MTTSSYLEGRLDASIRLMEAAVDPCVRKAHEGFVTRYRARLAESRIPVAPYQPAGQSGATYASGMRRVNRGSTTRPR